MKTTLKNEELDGRLNCFGEFNEEDDLCLYCCALNINCAIAKSRFFGYPFTTDDTLASWNNIEIDY